jgi:hypothetical protein
MVRLTKNPSDDLTTHSMHLLIIILAHRAFKQSYTRSHWHIKNGIPIILCSRESFIADAQCCGIRMHPLAEHVHVGVDVQSSGKIDADTSFSYRVLGRSTALHLISKR